MMAVQNGIQTKLIQVALVLSPGVQADDEETEVGKIRRTITTSHRMRHVVTDFGTVSH